MNQALVLLAAAYVLPLLLLVLLLLRSGWSNATKVAAILLVAAAYHLHYQGMLELTGRPSPAPAPDHFTLLAEEIHEPDPASREPGHILLWLRAAGDDEPRVHRLPYDQGLHEQLLRAQRRRAEGMIQEGERQTATPGAPMPGTGGDGFKIFDRPVHLPPPKDER